jgi:hypothetical protein
MKRIVADDSQVPVFIPDPEGYFLIRVGTMAIGVSHMRPDDTPGNTPTIIGISAEKLCHTVLNFYPWVTARHAAYLGRELQKAELAFAHNIAYEQDAPLPIAMVVDQEQR